MLVIPAIDILGGRIVRLERGDYATATVYSHRPAETAEAFARAGATRLHLVDLDGAREAFEALVDMRGALAARHRAGEAVAPALARVNAALAMTWSGAVVLLLLAVPMAGLTVAAALRRDARTVLYGPAGRYTRRATPFRLVAPSLGTRAQRAADPAVRAEMRRRIAAEGRDPFGLRDLDAEAGDRLWVDDSQPGARAAEVRPGDVEQGLLPDFGGEGSPYFAL